MKAVYSNQNQLQTTNTKLGALIGGGAGLLVGLTVSGTMLFLFGNSPVFAVGILTFFVGVFAAFGSFMGVLLDIDNRERNVNQLKVMQPGGVKPKRGKPQPLTLSRVS